MISDINDYSHNNNNNNNNGNNNNNNNNKVKISEGAYIHFSDLVKFLNDIKNSKINNSNIKKAYEGNIRDIEIKLLSTKRESNNVNKYIYFFNILKNKVDKNKQKNKTRKNKRAKIKKNRAKD